MDNKVLVNLVVPCINERYNVMLPINKNIGNIIILLNKAIHDLIGEKYIINNNLCLYDGTSGELISSNKYLFQTSIRNGSTVVMI